MTDGGSCSRPPSPRLSAGCCAIGARRSGRFSPVAAPRGDDGRNLEAGSTVQGGERNRRVGEARAAVREAMDEKRLDRRLAEIPSEQMPEVLRLASELY